MANLDFRTLRYDYLSEQEQESYRWHALEVADYAEKSEGEHSAERLQNAGQDLISPDFHKPGGQTDLSDGIVGGLGAAVALVGSAIQSSREKKRLKKLEKARSEMREFWIGVKAAHGCDNVDFSTFFRGDGMARD